MTIKTYKPILIDSVEATTDIEKHRFIGFNGSHCGKDAKALGVSDESTAKGQFVPVAIYGVLLIEVGGTVAVGDAITSDENGKAIKAENNAAINGYALDLGVIGDEIRIVTGI